MDCRTDLYIVSELVMSAEVRSNWYETQCEILHTLDAVVGALLGSAVGEELGSKDPVTAVGCVDG